jgi:hypothetical protein
VTQKPKHLATDKNEMKTDEKLAPSPPSFEKFVVCASGGGMP